LKFDFYMCHLYFVPSGILISVCVHDLQINGTCVNGEWKPHSVLSWLCNVDNQEKQ